MKAVQDSVAAYLQACTGVRTVADRTRARGEYPLLAVSVREDGTVLVDGGRQAEHTYRVRTAAPAGKARHGAAGTHGDPQFGHLTRKSLKFGGIYGSS